MPCDSKSFYATKNQCTVNIFYSFNWSSFLELLQDWLGLEKVSLEINGLTGACSLQAGCPSGHAQQH